MQLPPAFAPRLDVTTIAVALAIGARPIKQVTIVVQSKGYQSKTDEQSFEKGQADNRNECLESKPATEYVQTVREMSVCCLPVAHKETNLAS